MPKLTAKQRVVAQTGLIAAGALFVFCLTVLFSQGRELPAASASPPASMSLAQR